MLNEYDRSSNYKVSEQVLCANDTRQSKKRKRAGDVYVTHDCLLTNVQITYFGISVLELS